MVVEGDWPDAQRVHRYCCGRSLKDRKARDALSGFVRRFPQWLWRNQPTAAFVEWLRAHNETQDEGGRPPCGFYGMDVRTLPVAASC